MRTREQIEQQIRLDNPTSDGRSAGDPIYEQLISKWVDEMFNNQPVERKIWKNSAEFLSDFELTELAQIELSTDPTIAALRLILASWSGEVWGDDPRIQLGINKLVELGIITEERKGIILE